MMGEKSKKEISLPKSSGGGRDRIRKRRPTRGSVESCGKDFGVEAKSGAKEESFGQGDLVDAGDEADA